MELTMSARRKFNKEFKNDAVNLLESSNKTATAIAEELGIPRDALCRWRKELNDTTKQAFTGHGTPRDEEIARLKKENAELKMERDILKKAMAIFSKTEK